MSNRTVSAEPIESRSKETNTGVRLCARQPCTSSRRSRAWRHAGNAIAGYRDDDCPHHAHEQEAGSRKQDTR